MVRCEFTERVLDWPRHRRGCLLVAAEGIELTQQEHVEPGIALRRSVDFGDHVVDVTAALRRQLQHTYRECGHQDSPLLNYRVKGYPGTK